MGGRVYLLNSQGARLAKLYPGPPRTPEQFAKLVGENRLVEIAPTAALAVRAAGDDAQAGQLARSGGDVEAKETSEPAPRKCWFISLAIYAVQGRTDEAIGLLSIGDPWRLVAAVSADPHGHFASTRPLAELKTDSRFAPLRQQILGHLAKERAELGPVSL